MRSDVTITLIRYTLSESTAQGFREASSIYIDTNILRVMKSIAYNMEELRVMT